jgi:hypothetical protein
MTMLSSPSLRVLLTVVAYVAATFAVQGVSHFALNADHYRSISIMRPEPLFVLGFISMVIQGVLFAVLFPFFDRDGKTARNGLLFAWAIGLFLASYIALAEAGKYAVPSIAGWVGVEAGAAAAQFTLFGALLGLIHRDRRRAYARG